MSSTCRCRSALCVCSRSHQTSATHLPRAGACRAADCWGDRVHHKHCAPGRPLRLLSHGALPQRGSHDPGRLVLPAAGGQLNLPTRTLRLTLTPPLPAAGGGRNLFTMYSDSSYGNAGNGQSNGGFIPRAEVSGLTNVMTMHVIMSGSSRGERAHEPDTMLVIMMEAREAPK